MILGFVVILYPARYVSQPDIVSSDSTQVQIDMEEKFSNETSDLLAAASNITEVDEIEDGKISSAETHHYRERLKDIQDEGVEGNIKYIYVFLLKFSSNITGMIRLVFFERYKGVIDNCKLGFLAFSEKKLLI